MDLKTMLMLERAELDQSWAEIRALFLKDHERIMRLWQAITDDKAAIRSFDDEELMIVSALAMLAMKELLQRTGSLLTDLKDQQ